MSHNWSATKQRLHPQSVAEISRHSVLSGDRIRQCETSSGSRHKDTSHRSLSVSRHFLLQAPQCPCSVRKRLSRDHCCRGRSKPGCRIVGSHNRWELTTEHWTAPTDWNYSILSTCYTTIKISNYAICCVRSCAISPMYKMRSISIFAIFFFYFS